MHRTIETSVKSDLTDDIVEQLRKNVHVVGLNVLRKVSIIPEGDTLIIHVLNKGSDEVMSVISEHTRNSHFSVITSEVASINDSREQKKINQDVDEAIWEEMETGLRHNGKLTANYLALMCIGGVITSIGLVSETHLSVTALVAASIIAPGMEPLGKIPLGIVLKRPDVLKAGIISSLVGYLFLTICSCLAYLLISGLGEIDSSDFVSNDAVKSLAKSDFKSYLLSFVAAAASIIMYLSYRRNVIAGPLVVLILIPAAGAMGISAMCGEWYLFSRCAEKLGIDVLLIVAVGSALIYLKQKFVHKRLPLR
jgi:virulence-associated protein VagC